MLRMKIEDRDELRAAMLANNETVMAEMARRSGKQDARASTHFSDTPARVPGLFCYPDRSHLWTL
jgi:hypothetical protein